MNKKNDDDDDYRVKQIIIFVFNNVNHCSTMNNKPYITYLVLNNLNEINKMKIVWEKKVFYC